MGFTKSDIRFYAMLSLLSDFVCIRLKSVGVWGFTPIKNVAPQKLSRYKWNDTRYGRPLQIFGGSEVIYGAKATRDGFMNTDVTDR